MYILHVTKTAQKDIKKLDKPTLKKLDKALLRLRSNPFQTNTEKLTNHPLAEYRHRIGNYRILFDLFSGQIVKVIHIWHRGKDYKK